MAKIALIFLLFALFAVAMSGRVTREEATATPLTLETIKEEVGKLLNSPQAKELAKGVQTFNDGALNLLKDVSNKLNQGIQNTGGKS